MGAPVTILTDFRTNKDKLLAYADAYPGCKVTEGTEPALFSAAVAGDLDADTMALVLDAGFHVESSPEGGTSIIGRDEGLLGTFLRRIGLAAEIKSDGGNPIVELIVPRLSSEKEVEAVRQGFRVGRHALADALKLAS